MKLFASNVKVEKEIEVHTQDIIDAIGTLSPKGKLSVPFIPRVLSSAW